MRKFFNKWLLQCVTAGRLNKIPLSSLSVIKVFHRQHSDERIAHEVSTWRINCKSWLSHFVVTFNLFCFYFFIFSSKLSGFSTWTSYLVDARRLKVPKSLTQVDRLTRKLLLMQLLMSLVPNVFSEIAFTQLDRNYRGYPYTLLNVMQSRACTYNAYVYRKCWTSYGIVRHA